MNKYLIFVFITLALVAGCKDKVKEENLWGVYQEPIEAESLPKDSGAEEINKLWGKDIGSGAAFGFALLKPEYYGESLFVADRSGKVFRLDSGNGTVIWQADLDQEIFSGVGVNENLVVVTHDNGSVTGLHADNGSIAWVVSIKRQISAIAAIGEGRVILRTANGLIIGLNAKTGDIVWQVEKATPLLSMHGDSTPVITHDAVLVGLSSGKLIANNVVNGRDYWETEISFIKGKDEIERLTDSDTVPIVREQIVFTGTYQGSVVALQLQNAELIWRAKVSTRLPMAMSGDRLFVIGELGEVTGVNAINGDILWEQQIFRGHGVNQIVTVGDRVIIGDAKGRIHTMAVDSGVLIESKKVVSGAVLGMKSNGNQFAVFSSEGDLSVMSL